MKLHYNAELCFSSNMANRLHQLVRNPFSQSVVYYMQSTDAQDK